MNEHAWRAAAVDWQERALYYRAEVEMLRRCLIEHHAHGVLVGVLVGVQCPVCAEFLRSPTSPPADAVEEREARLLDALALILKVPGNGTVTNCHSIAAAALSREEE